ncbi:UNVERIFIED_CONTAM: Trk K+ transport system NAD-binding subunit [Williamsia faeni]
MSGQKSSVPTAARPEMTGHVIVCGFAGIGMRIVDQLVSSGEKVTLVVRSVEPALDAAVERWQVPFHTAVVSVADALKEAGIATAIAVICVEERELWNLETALIAGEIRPDLRVIAQVSNATVSGAMNDATAPGLVLDPADLAAPSVVEACLGITVHNFDIGGHSFVAADLEVTTNATLRTLFGDLAPVAVVGKESEHGSDLIACPGRDLAVAAGDYATMIGTPKQFAALKIPLISGEEPQPRTSSGPHMFNRIAGASRGFVEDANPNFFRMVGVLGLLLVISTAVLRFGYQRPGMTGLDAVYFSTETIATVGYGDFNFADQPTWLRIWSILLMFAGVTTTAMIMAFLAELLITRRLSQSLGRRRARYMSGHVVVIGLGAFGIRVARELKARGRDVVIIERYADNRFISTARQLDIPIVIGDATVSETLVDARVDRAAAVAVLTSDDMVNIETGIAVKGILGPRWLDRPGTPGVPVVLRVFDRPLGVAVSNRFGFRYVRSTAELAAPWFIGAALGLDVLGTFSIRTQSFMIGLVHIAAGGGLDGVAMSQLSANTRVIAIRRAATGQLEYPPRRGTSFAAGDDAYVVGPYEELLLVLEHERGVSV